MAESSVLEKDAVLDTIGAIVRGLSIKTPSGELKAYNIPHLTLLSGALSTTSKTMSGGHYHPENSKVSEKALIDFVRAPLSGNIKDVPGIGDATADLLKVCVSAPHLIIQECVYYLYPYVGLSVSFYIVDVPMDLAVQLYCRPLSVLHKVC